MTSKLVMLTASHSVKFFFFFWVFTSKIISPLHARPTWKNSTCFGILDVRNLKESIDFFIHQVNFEPAWTWL